MDMSSNTNFFESPQAAAIYKHKLLKSYIPAWAGKVGSTAAGRSVVVYDAYSGPGRYENDEPGSPELLVDTALAMSDLRTVRTIFSEKDKEYCEKLSAMLASKDGLDSDSYEVRIGPVETHMDAVLASCGDLPLFVFLDPYGLTVSFEDVVTVLKSRNKPGYSRLLQPKTELLMNFSYEAVRRISGVVRSDKDYPARQGQLAALDQALGGDWWRQLAAEEPEGWVESILEGYAHRVAAAVGDTGYITADVADSLEAKPVYELILFTSHRDGLWEMARSMSLARAEWRKWLVERREEQTGGQVEFRGLDFGDDSDAWVNAIETNIECLLAEGRSFRLEDKLGEVLGHTLGLARETHIRKALMRMWEGGERVNFSV